MKDNILKKEWSKKDVKRARNLIQGKVNERTTKGIGYNKKQEFYNEGDIWEEGGRTWTIKNGIKQNKPKLQIVRDAVLMPICCPQCGTRMKKKLDKIYRIMKIRTNYITML